MSKHPIQPLYTDDAGVLRFKQNAIVRHLVNQVGMNKLSELEFPREDWEQLAQLIGYSIAGFEELDYVSDETYAAALMRPAGE